jgi:hypothetical protein
VQGDLLLNVASPPLMQGCMWGDILFLASSAILVNWGLMRTIDLSPCMGGGGSATGSSTVEKQKKLHRSFGEKCI